MSETIAGIIKAIAFILGSFILALFSRWFLRLLMARFCSKTKSELDDVIVKALGSPLMLAIIAAGTYGAVVTALNLEVWELSADRIEAYSDKTIQVFKALFILIMAFGALRVLNGIGRWYVVSTDSQGVAHQVDILKKLLSIGIWTIVVVLVFGQLGYQVSALLATLGVAGLAVALALQDTLANIFAGFYILADKSVKAGDYIKLESGDEGFVEEVGWRNTRIRLWANNTVIVPNAKLIQSTLTNYEMPRKQLSVYVPCGVSYNSDLEHVEKVTVDCAKQVLMEVPGGVKNFEPVVRFKEFGDSNINFIVVLRSKDVASQYLIQHEFIKRLHRRYRDEGIDISYPVRIVMQNADSD